MWTTLEALMDDARSGARILTTAPGVSAVAILLIALVVGGNTTIFGAVHGLLTKPAPGVDPAGLASIGWVTGSEPLDAALSYPDYADLAVQSRSLSVLAARIEQFTLIHHGGTTSVSGASVSGNYFETLGVRLARGRGFSDADDQRNAPALVAIISDAMWRSQFAGTDDVLGQLVTLNGRTATIIGVAPSQFQGTSLAEGTEIWVPLVAYAQLDQRARDLTDRSAITVHMTIGRLAPGVTLAQAQHELSAVSERLQAAAPGRPKRDAIVLPYSGTAATGTLFSEQAPRFLAVFSVVTALTLLIVSANVANLLLARAIARQREISVRQSLGASRWRVVRLVVAEALTLAAVACIAGFLFAVWMSRLIPGLIPPSASGDAAMVVDLSPDWTVLGYAMALAVAGALAFSIAPAMRTWRQDLLTFLKAGERGASQGRSRISRGLVVLQLAGSVVLLTSAGLAYRSLSLMTGVPVGFSDGDFLLVTVDTASSVATPEANRGVLDLMLEQLRAIPGVSAAAYAREPPQSGWESLAIRANAAQDARMPEHNVVSSEYFALAGLSPIVGRGFADREPSRGSSEIVINQHLAESLWPGQVGIGRRVLLGAGGQERAATVIGIVPNIYVGGFRQIRPQLVFLSAQHMPPRPGQTTFYVRHAGPVASVVPAIGRALQSVDATVPLVRARTMTAELEAITWHVRVLTTLLTLFAAGSLLMATLGQYAAMAFAMRRRERDFGIRLALGASTRQLLASALGEGVGLTATGLLIGLGVGYLTARSASGLLYGITPTDAATHAGTIVVLGVASLVACYLPARRVAHVDPVHALRQD